MSPETIRDKAAALLVELGVGEDCVISPYPAAGRNVPFHCRHRGNELVIKGYPTLEAHGIDPFAAECAFYDYLESIRPEQTPQARGWDGEQRVGVLSLWPGRPPKPVELGTEFVRAAGRFIAIINHRRHELPSTFPSLPQREESISALLQSINQTLIEGLPRGLACHRTSQALLGRGSSARLASSDGGDPFRPASGQSRLQSTARENHGLDHPRRPGPGERADRTRQAIRFL